MQHVFEKIRELIAAKKGVSQETITMAQSFEDLEMDSLDSVEVISDLEDHFNVSIPNQEVLQIKTIEEAVNSLSKLVNA
ncbi:MAG: acyl carrier protein [Sphingobacteriales bacterium]|jgi:acyl carrier protein